LHAHAASPVFLSVIEHSVIELRAWPGRPRRRGLLRPGCAACSKEDAMLFAVHELESEICKLRGLLQMLHEDQPDVLEDVFEFHVGSLISHAGAEHHGYIRTCAQEMLAAVRALPRHAGSSEPTFRLMPDMLARPA